jgi:acetyl-CoA carboxylase carboxyl transferase subunit alpha
MSTLNAYTGTYELDFERPLLQLERQINELEIASKGAPLPGASAVTSVAPGVDLGNEVRKLRQSHTAMLKKIYAKLGAWHTVKVARHPGRPQSIHYIQAFVKDFCELHGDRRFGDDPAILTGFGRIGPHKCMVIAHNKGRDTKERIACHFGCAHPEGYRKALAKMKLAEKFGVPVVSLIDTPGAYPGLGSEQRGVAEAIALNLLEMSRLRVPIITVIIGEGGSGGALGIGVGDRVAMMQYAWYSVISPEGCAAILWKTGDKAPVAADALKLTAADNIKLGTVDDIIEEPLGGAHRNPAVAADRVEKYIVQALRELKRFKIDNLVQKRFDRLRHIGKYEEA